MCDRHVFGCGILEYYIAVLKSTSPSHQQRDQVSRDWLPVYILPLRVKPNLSKHSISSFPVASAPFGQNHVQNPKIIYRCNTFCPRSCLYFERNVRLVDPIKLQMSSDHNNPDLTAAPVPVCILGPICIPRQLPHVSQDLHPQQQQLGDKPI
jgi:hypothetical protein